jgi:hypothetical protein
MTSIEVAAPTTYDKFKAIQEAGKLHIKGYTNVDIGEVLQIDTRTAKAYVQEYLDIVKQVGEDNPYFLEEIQFNTLKALDEMNEISKEAWETVEIATEAGMVGSRIQALKLALDVGVKKANLHQLMGGTNSDGEYIARMQKAENVNLLLSKIIRDVISECESCRTKARGMLKEAFAMMEESGEGFSSAEDAADHLNFEDAEVVAE